MGWISNKADARFKGIPLQKGGDKVEKMRITSNGTTKYLFERQIVIVTEYRGLTETLAMQLAEDSAYNSDSRTFGSWTPFSITYVGVVINGNKKAASARRVNEAAGWTLTVTETITTTTTQ